MDFELLMWFAYIPNLSQIRLPFCEQTDEFLTHNYGVQALVLYSAGNVSFYMTVQCW